MTTALSSPSTSRPIVSTIRMTAEQYLQLGDDPPGVRLELVEGEIAVSPSPTPRHNILVNLLAHLLTGHVLQHGLGGVLTDTDTPVSPFTVRRPDILFFRTDRMHLVGEDRLNGPPDLAVEVVSPSSGQIDRRDKFEQYAAAGIRYYWIIDPETRTFDAFELRDGAYTSVTRGRDEDTVQAAPFADLEIPLDSLWWRD